MFACGVERGHGAEGVRRDALGRLRDGLERVRQLDVAGDALEYPALARGKQLARLRSVMSVMLPRISRGPKRAGARGGPRRECRGPVESQCVHSKQGASPASARSRWPRDDAERRVAVGLHRWADPLRPDGEQFLARHLEEAHGVVVALDEAAEVHVEHDDGLGRVLDQRAVAGLAVADRRLGELAVRRVAQADDEHLAPVEPDLAHAEFCVEQRPVHAPAPGLARRKVDLRVLERLGEFLKASVRSRAACERRDQQVEPAAANGVSPGSRTRARRCCSASRSGRRRPRSGSRP